MRKRKLCNALIGILTLGFSNHLMNAGIPVSRADGTIQVPTVGYGGYTLPCWTIGEQPYIQKEYERWKKQYVVADGAGGYLRVQRDSPSNYDTVSEGIGYGMLLAAWMGDDATLDGLNEYRKLHLNSNGLMHWRVDRYGNDIDEFGEYVYPFGDPRNARTLQNAWSGLTYTKGIYDIQRSLTSAADADLDMAAALSLRCGRGGTSARWWEAVKLARNVWDNDIVKSGNDYYVANGCGDWDVTGKAAWGGPSCWNPSYVTFAWFPLFAKMDREYTSKWNALYDSTMAKFVDMNNRLCNGWGEFPDFVDSSSGDYVQAHGFLTPTVDANNPSMTGPGVDGKQSDRGKSSFNFYYDGVRVPWRLSLDRSWQSVPKNPDELTILEGTVAGSDWVNPNSVPLALYYFVDGWDCSGNWWNLDHADWNNTTTNQFDANGNENDKNALGQYIARGGVNIHSTTFMSMMATPYMAQSKPGAQAAYTMLKNYWDDPNDPNNPNNYFGNALRMLSLVYMSGNAVDFSQATWNTPPQPLCNVWMNKWDQSDNEKYVEIYIEANGVGYIQSPYVARYFINLDGISDDVKEGIAQGRSSDYIVPSIESDPTNRAEVSELRIYDQLKKIYYFDVTVGDGRAGHTIAPDGYMQIIFKYTLTGNGITPEMLNHNYSDEGFTPGWYSLNTVPLYGRTGSISYGVEPTVVP